VFCFDFKKKTSKNQVAASFYPVYIATLNVLDGTGIPVAEIARGHDGCPHNFTLSPKNMKVIENSLVLIINGAGMENFVEKITSRMPDKKVIDSSLGIELITNKHGHGNEHEKNPHIWLSIKNHMEQVKNISKGLCEIFPEFRTKIKKNEEIYLEKLKVLCEKGRRTFEPFKGKGIVTFHSAFNYFAKEFGLELLAVVLEEPDEEPSAKELLKTIETIKNCGVKYLFVEEDYNKKIAETIVKETGVIIMPVHSITFGGSDSNAYIKYMEDNFEIFAMALD
jgi:zinc transport system substrate-binding protein